MRALTLIPLAGLAAMLVVVGLALRDGPALAVDFGQAPARADLPSPDLGVGDLVFEGRLLGADGRPVEGASLFVVQKDRPIWTYSDAEGRFHMEDLHPGPVEVAVHAPGHMATILRAEADGTPVELRLTDVLAEVQPLPNPARVDLRGHVEAPTVDLTGFELVLLPTAPATEAGTGVPRRTRADAQGEFTFEQLTPAEYELLLLPPWAASGTWPDLLTALNAPALRLAHPQSSPLLLTLATGTITGSAFEKESGEPVAGAMVVAVPVPESMDSTDPRRFPPTRTDSAGAYRLPLLPPGRYRVTLTAGAEVRAAEVEVLPGVATDPGF